MNSFRTFMCCDLWPYVMWPLALCSVSFGFPSSKKNSLRGNYMRKYGTLFFIQKYFFWKMVLFSIPLNKLLCCNSSFLSRHNLTVTTNLNAFGADITYRITKPPSSGIILKDDVPVLSFTALDVFDECIEYRHNNSHATKGKYIFLKFGLRFPTFKIHIP